jgi:hypothetical protein
MIKRTLLAAAVLFSSTAYAEERVDANIVTGIDVSSSFSYDEVSQQIDFMIAAMQSEEVQQRIAHGRYGRIGFAAFVWSNECAPVIEWRIVSSAEDIAKVVVDLKAASEAVKKARGASEWSGLTDISNAMLCGLASLKSAPYKTYRNVLNINTNGEDNVGSDKTHSDCLAAKAELEAADVTVNAMVLPGGASFKVLAPFLEAFVKVGGTAFVTDATLPERMMDAWRRKFIGDMV